jgi:uncharacterized protein (DUF433 family)
MSKYQEKEWQAEVWRAPKESDTVFLPARLNQLPELPEAGQWFQVKNYPLSLVANDAWFGERLRNAILMLDTCVESDPEIRGGTPVIKGTRIPVARVFSEIAGGMTCYEIAADFDLDVSMLVGIFEGLACYLDRPLSR